MEDEAAVSWEALEKFPEALGSSSEAHEVELHWLGFFKIYGQIRQLRCIFGLRVFIFCLFVCLFVFDDK